MKLWLPKAEMNKLSGKSGGKQTKRGAGSGCDRSLCGRLQFDNERMYKIDNQSSLALKIGLLGVQWNFLIGGILEGEDIRAVTPEARDRDNFPEKRGSSC